jgi:hypothetical protein
LRGRFAFPDVILQRIERCVPDPGDGAWLTVSRGRRPVVVPRARSGGTAVSASSGRCVSRRARFYPTQEHPVHGIVMNQFRQFALERMGRDGWREAADAAGVGHEVFEIGRIYPDEALGTLVAETARRTGEAAPALVEEFGVFIAPALLRVYEMLVDPAWRTLDVIEHTEQVIHTVVRAKMPGAAPPLLDARRTAPDTVVIDYRSPRRLCSLARGIARGMALHFGETVEIDESECMHAGDPRCLITVHRTGEAPTTVDAAGV